MERVNWSVNLIHRGGLFAVEYVTPDAEAGHSLWYSTQDLAVSAFMTAKKNWERNKRLSEQKMGREEIE